MTQTAKKKMYIYKPKQLEGEGPLVLQNDVKQDEIEHNICNDNSVLSASVKVRTGQTVTVLKKIENVQCRAKVLNAAGIAIGKYKNWYNLQFLKAAGSHGQK